MKADDRVHTLVIPSSQFHRLTRRFNSRTNINHPHARIERAADRFIPVRVEFRKMDVGVDVYAARLFHRLRVSEKEEKSNGLTGY